MSNALMVIATLLTAIATIAIAIFTKTNLALSKRTLELTNATQELNKAVKESADKHQDDMKTLQIELAAVTLLAACRPTGASPRPDTLKEFRKIITDSLQ